MMNFIVLFLRVSAASKKLKSLARIDAHVLVKDAHAKKMPKVGEFINFGSFSLGCKAKAK